MVKTQPFTEKNGEYYHCLTTGDLINGYTDGQQNCIMRFPGIESCTAIIAKFICTEPDENVFEAPFLLGHHAPPGSYDKSLAGEIYCNSETDSEFLDRIFEICWKRSTRIELYGTAVHSCYTMLQNIRQKILKRATDTTLDFPGRIEVNTHCIELKKHGFRTPDFIQTTEIVDGVPRETGTPLIKVEYNDGCVIARSNEDPPLKIGYTKERSPSLYE